MRLWIKLFEAVDQTPTEIVIRVRDEFVAETGETPHQINRGQCFEFADALETAAPRLFQSLEIGNFYRYTGEYKDEPVGFDEKLLKTWPSFKPVHGLTWKQMFEDVGLSWPGTHGWAYCKQTGLCYDIETPEGKANPFELSFFESWFDHYHKNKVTEK